MARTIIENGNTSFGHIYPLHFGFFFSHGKNFLIVKNESRGSISIFLVSILEARDHSIEKKRGTYPAFVELTFWEWVGDK